MSVEEVNIGKVHGWGCTPTGDPPPAAISSELNETNRTKCLPAVFIKGWRRTTLYAILVFLMLLIFLNIALTLWIISALKLNMRGIGPIKIVKGGIQLDGDAWVMDNLITSTITSRIGQPITVHSHRNFTVLVTESSQPEYAKLFIKRNNIEFSGRIFQIHDAHGESVFYASRDEVRVLADTLAVDGPGGIAVKNSVQTPTVQAPPGSDLQLESSTRRLHLRAPQSIHLESRAGGIDIEAYSNVSLVSIVGAMKIESPNIILSNLKEATITEKPQRSKNGRAIKVYQLCACASGKLFLAAPDVLCFAHDDETELCR